VERMDKNAEEPPGRRLTLLSRGDKSMEKRGRSKLALSNQLASRTFGKSDGVGQEFRSVSHTSGEILSLSNSKIRKVLMSFQ
jgi:hypothetical protein